MLLVTFQILGLHSSPLIKKKIKSLISVFFKKKFIKHNKKLILVFLINDFIFKKQSLKYFFPKNKLFLYTVFKLSMTHSKI